MQGEVGGAPGGDQWTALGFDGQKFDVEVPEGSSVMRRDFAEISCIAKVHEHIQTEVRVMAESAIVHLLKCNFAEAERQALKMVGCGRVGIARDLGGGKWENRVYMNCIVAAARLCTAKYHASKGSQVIALRDACEARTILHELQSQVENVGANQYMVTAVEELLQLCQLLDAHIERVCT